MLKNIILLITGAALVLLLGATMPRRGQVQAHGPPSLTDSQQSYMGMMNRGHCM